MKDTLKLYIALLSAFLCVAQPPIGAAKNLTEVMRLPLSGDANVLVYSPNGEMVAIGYKDGSINIWRLADRSLLSRFSAHTKAVSTLEFMSDSKRLLSMGGEHQLCLWSVPEGKNLRTINDVGWSGVLGKDDRVFAAESKDQTVNLWDLQTGEITKKLSHKITGGIYSLAFTPGHKYLVTAYMAGLVSDSETGAQDVVMLVASAPLKIEMLPGNQAAISMGELDDETAPIRKMVAGRSTQSVAVVRWWAGKPDIVEIWNVENKSKTATVNLKGKGGPLSFSFDESMLAVGNEKGITIWDLRKRKQAGQREGGGVFEFSPSSPDLAATSSNDLVIYRVE